MKKNIILKLLLIPLISANVFTIISLLSGFNYYADIICNFAFQFFIIQFICLLFTSNKYKKTALISLFIMLLNLYQIIPLYFSHDNFTEDSKKNSLSIIQLNIYRDNKDYPSVKRLLDKYKPDIFLINELCPDAATYFSKELTDYKLKKLIPRNDFFGVGIFSKIDIKVKDLYLKKTSTPIINADFKFDNNDYSIYFTHLASPETKTMFDNRTAQLQELTHIVKTNNNRIIIAGDFNLTSYSSYFKRFIKNTSLKDSRKGFGLQNSWPTFTPIFRICLDHFFISPEIKVLDRKVLEPIGSDHFPVLLYLSK